MSPRHLLLPAGTPAVANRHSRGLHSPLVSRTVSPEGTWLADWPLASGDLSTDTTVDSIRQYFFFNPPPKDAAMHCTKKRVIESDCQSNGHMCRFTETGAGCMACWDACLSQKSEPTIIRHFINLFICFFFFNEFKSTFKPGTAIHLRAFIQFVSVNLVHYPHRNKYFELDRKKTTTTNFEPLKLLSSCLQEKRG